MGVVIPERLSPPFTKGADGVRPASLLLSQAPSPWLNNPRTRLALAQRNGGAVRSGSSHCGGIGSPAAGLAGVLVAGEVDDVGNRNNGRVLLGCGGSGQGPSGGDLQGSPIEFGVKNRDAQLALLSPVQRSPLSSAAARLARRSEVEELAEEDYTCVIARGPNPKMTHIFEDRVVESRAGAGDDGGSDACRLLTSCSVCKKDCSLAGQ
ncbi:hypothetical protein HU200_000484 [Digitaria exilis]|uniref:Uncharacterized protein n=1 Tax=Digitaria exilis TaxID=1010633 RepID=A0A835G1T2_9POAL|nr:hypothetical protein HU200_000484 [Digitaria exilis]